MYRESLCDDCGMLFIFTNADFHNFWMKNTLIPLDIIYINADLTVVDIMHAEPCYADNCTIYTPKKVALFVLETNVNKFDESIIGKKIRISTK